MFKKITEFSPEFIYIEIRHDIIQPLIIFDITDPVAEYAVRPAQARFHIDYGDADRQILDSIGRSLIDTLGNSIEKLADFPVPFRIGLVGQNINTTDDNTGKERNDPIIKSNDQEQYQYDADKRLFIAVG